MQYAKLNMLKSLDSTWLTQVIKVENCDDEEDIKQFKHTFAFFLKNAVVA